MILRGRTISSGAFEGRAHVLDARAWLEAASSIPAVAEPADEIERLQAARALASAQLEQVERQLAQHGRKEDAEIFAAHLAILRDPTLLERIESEIRMGGRSAEAAVAVATKTLHTDFQSSRMAMVRDKAPDVLDIGHRLLVCLDPRAKSRAAAEGATVLIGSTLTPSDLVRLHQTGPCAALTESGGERSHVAILARSLGVPLLSGISGVVQSVREGALVLVDAERGIAIVDPEPDEESEVRRIRGILERHDADVPAPGQPSTLDAVPVHLALNVSGPRDAEHVRPLGAMGVGLLRTEFLYMASSTWPDEAQCLAAYEEIAASVGEGELYIRLADFGADKRPEYADFPISRNPSLGARGVRLLLQRDDVLGPQVRALARLAAARPLVVLVPMLDTLDTLHRLKSKLAELCRSKPGTLPFRLGAMIEVPAAALSIEEILDEVEVAAIGLNDLTQYVMAADREDESVEQYHDALQPAVLRLVRTVVEAGQRRGKSISVCGELAGDRALAIALLALGIRRFSVSRPDYQAATELIRRVSIGDLETRRDRLLGARSGRQVRQILNEMSP